MKTVTIAATETYWPELNWFVQEIGKADGDVYIAAGWRKGGELFAASSGKWSEKDIDDLISSPSVVAWQGGGEAPNASSVGIFAIIGTDGTDALSLLGLAPITYDI